MRNQESENREIEGYNLTIILKQQKLIVRAVEKETNDLFICQFRIGELPADINFIYESGESFFDALISESVKVRIDKARLVVPYAFNMGNRLIQRQLITPLVKVQASEIETLQRKVNKLEEQSRRVDELESQLKTHQSILQILQKGANLYYYRPGVFRPLVLIEENNSVYKIRGSYLSRKPDPNATNSASTSLSIAKCLISNEPLQENDRLVSYKFVISDTSRPKERVFIGLCTKIPPGMQPKGIFSAQNKIFQFIVPKQGSKLLCDRQFLDNQTRKPLCQQFYGINGRQTYKNWYVEKGDTYVMTVDLENCHLTWYKNEVSVERSYFEHPQANLYPFVYLYPNVEVVF